MNKESYTALVKRGGAMECPECSKELEVHDTTYSNINTHRAKVGQHTGDIYKCDDCEESWHDNFLTGQVTPWRG